MSVTDLIVIQLVFLLLLSWVFAFVVIRALRRNNQEQARLLNDFSQKKGHRLENSSKPNVAGKEDMAASLDESSSEQAGDIAASMSDLDSEFEDSSRNVSELDDLLQAQSVSILRLRKMREEMDGKSNTVSNEALTNELTALKEKNERSETVITDLKSNLNSSRSRINAVEKRMARLKTVPIELDRLERENKRLSGDRSKLEQKIKTQMFQHQQVIDRIQSRLNLAEDRSQEGIRKAKSREQSLLHTISELQDKLRDDVIGDKTEEELNQLKGELVEAQRALKRAESEKEFLETHYLDLEEALRESAGAKEELERTRKEYEMLERHFLAMEESEENKRQDHVEQDILKHEKHIDTLKPVEVASVSGISSDSC